MLEAGKEAKGHSLNGREPLRVWPQRAVQGGSERLRGRPATVTGTLGRGLSWGGCVSAVSRQLGQGSLFGFVFLKR